MYVVSSATPAASSSSKDINLCQAIPDGNLDQVLALLASGANANCFDSEPLLLAIICSDIELIKVILENGGDVHARGSLALRFARDIHNPKVIALVREAARLRSPSPI